MIFIYLCTKISNWDKNCLLNFWSWSSENDIKEHNQYLKENPLCLHYEDKIVYVI
jgi:hypothetical protein